ncbi:beta-ketoacyl synthase N-terminal-like domain-containing protein [Streptomyces sp. NPDC017966]|uniref:beta-ketoacyl synthase N-terminal-like domain-containing protein n=1 Tax=Streptomyces sp. NPDC017966 TaxID=3365023 RepID=UPI00379B5AD3
MSDGRRTTMDFEPVAIVGRGCVLPGALDPGTFWDNVRAGRVSLSRVPEGRWRLPEGVAVGAGPGVGGYVHGFDDVFDPGGFVTGADRVRAFDPCVRFVLHAARQALREAGADRPYDPGRAGLVMGNLSLPTDGLAAYAEAVWRGGERRPDALGRFSSGLPAELAAAALGLEGGAYALDAACASALYAVKLACDRLHDRTADLMVAGAVNRTDDLAVHLAFDALSALSPTGRSRPLHRDADGLVPAEGAAFVALMRLTDALAQGRRVLGVVRGAGLSNDGRTGGLLAPSPRDQIRAVRQAYAHAGLAPESLSYLECHATGTPVGDAAEAEAMAEVFAGCRDLPVGSVKANIGHLVTAAGGAGILKVLAAMEAGVRPPTPGAAEPVDALRDGPLRPLVDAEDWDGPRRAGINAFGFGGNNAHLILDAWTGDDGHAPALPSRPAAPRRNDPEATATATATATTTATATAAAARVPAVGVPERVPETGAGDPAAVDRAPAPGSPDTPCPGQAPASDPVAVVALGVRVADGAGLDAFRDALLTGTPLRDPAGTYDVALPDLRFPPADLARSLGQQTAVLEAARDAARGITLPRERTMVLIGMGCDPEVARYPAEARRRTGDADAQAAPLAPGLTAPAVVGTMPNVVANRISAQLDTGGPAFTVSAEEASGLVAVDLGTRALRRREADVVLAGAVDLSQEPVHRAALADLDRSVPAGDAAVVVVLKRLADARRDGDDVLAVLDPAPAGPAASAAAPAAALVVGPADAGAHDPTERAEHAERAEGTEYTELTEHFDPAGLFGTPHAAQGALALACAVLALRHGAIPRTGGPADPALDHGRTARVKVRTLGGTRVTLGLRADRVMPWAPRTATTLHVFSGRDAAGALAAARAGTGSDTGPARLVVAADDPATLTARVTAAERWLTAGGVRPEGVAFAARPVTGETALVFTNGTATYPGMARGLMLALPAPLHGIRDRWGPLQDIAGWAYRDPADRTAPHSDALDRIWGAALVAQLHTAVSRDVLRLPAHAAIGYSSGESTALVALGAWRDVPRLIDDARRSDIFTTRLAGPMTDVRRHWRALGIPEGRWASYAVHAPEDALRDALAAEPAVHLMARNAPGVQVIGGEAGGCRRVLDRLGTPDAIPLDYDIAVHVPEAAAVRETCRALHHRETHPVPGIRFYSATGAEPYVPDTDRAADAVTDQTLGPLDFTAAVERAWRDGVRVFVEHGPGALCTGWTSRILAGRDHLAVAMDGGPDRGVPHLVRAVAELTAAGVPVDHAALAALLRRGMSAPPPPPATVRVPARLPEVPPPAALPPARESASGATRATRATEMTESTKATRATQVTESTEATEAIEESGPPSSPDPEPMLPAPALPPVGADPVPAHGEAATPAAPQGVPTPGAPPAQRVPRVPPTHPGAPAGPSPAAVGTAAPASPAVHIAAAHRAYLDAAGTAHRRYLAWAAAVHARTTATPAPLAPAATPLAPAPAPPYGTAPGPMPVRAPVSPTHGPYPTPTSVPAPAPAPVPAHTPPPSPLFDRAQLERLADGPVAEVLGPEFRELDGFRRQVRMPRPPMLLVDRVLAVDAVPNRLGTGAIHTETDVTGDDWYLDPTGRMPASLMVEAGQADLLLIAWMGVDRFNRGERVYRLLGCELTYHDSPPEPGATLRFDIRVDGHGEHDGIRLFFFHYDCHIDGRPALSVRAGQAGFFTDAELASTQGVLWDPADEEPGPGRVDPPPVPAPARAFTREEVTAFSEGRPADCFGPDWDAARAQTRPPRIAGGRMLMLSEVTRFDPEGGPWGRGYLRATTPVSPDDWFFAGHFKDDPCMPGTLMYEGCLQAMSFYLAALGCTLDADGWRFEPVTGRSVPMRCRGQVTPAARELVYEVFVTEVTGGPVPTLIADVLCTVDGVKSFHARRAALRLVPDWPLARRPELTASAAAHGTAPELLASALGRPSAAFGPMYGVFDGVRRAPRLPAPPYQFVSRVVSATGEPGAMTAGAEVVTAYDVPADAWYWPDGPRPQMPPAVLMEAALQPCGWLASHTGCALAEDGDLLFRNLDGTLTAHAPVTPATRTLTTRAVLKDISRHAGMVIVSFDVECADADGLPVLSASTVFGFFPREAFARQTGLPGTAPDPRAETGTTTATEVSLVLPPAARPAPTPSLLMLDRITAFRPDGGRDGLGRIAAQKDIDAGEWFFKAHFFQDPVQPGSLGLQAMYQAFQACLTAKGLTVAGTPAPAWEYGTFPGAGPLTWTYRGQVTPATRTVTVELEIRSLVTDPDPDTGLTGPGSVTATAEAWLWADGVRIYHAHGLTLRATPGAGTHESTGERP